MRLTIGMAVYEDFDGVYFTVQALRMYHDLAGVELIVVDNKPDSAAGKLTRDFVTNWAGRGNAGARYIAMPEATGTTQPRQRVFDEAKGEAVLCIDSHVLLAPGMIERLIQFYADNPDCQDLLTGPILYDDLQTISTHFIDQWRAEMWGVWGHDPRGDDPNGEPFEIWGQGLGLFTCRRDAWLGFNPHFRGFGGEEGYIHEKYRQAGRKTLCLPWLRWGHRFGRLGGVKYPLTRWNKIRNYVLGHVELGLPLDSVYDHFVSPDTKGEPLAKHFVEVHGVDPKELAGKSEADLVALHRRYKMPSHEWDYLVADPIGREHGPTLLKVTVPIEKPDEARAAIYATSRARPRDLDQHMETLRKLASQCTRVEEITRRQESTVAFLAAQPAQLRTRLYGPDVNSQVIRTLEQVAGKTTFTLDQRSGFHADWDIDECDLLFVKPDHQDARFGEHLQRWAGKVTRWIAVHDTSTHGEKWDDGSPGPIVAIREFLERHPDWFVYSHTPAQWGLTVLGCREEDRPAHKVHAWPPGYGPGTELSKMLETLGINPGPTCDCKAKARQMDLWGVEGCRENREQIVGWMRDGQGRWGWKDKLAAATKAVTTGLAFKLDWSDPFPSLIDEAIRRAEQAEGKAAVAA